MFLKRAYSATCSECGALDCQAKSVLVVTCVAEVIWHVCLSVLHLNSTITTFTLTFSHSSRGPIYIYANVDMFGFMFLVLHKHSVLGYEIFYTTHTLTPHTLMENYQIIRRVREKVFSQSKEQQQL